MRLWQLIVELLGACVLAVVVKWLAVERSFALHTGVFARSARQHIHALKEPTGSHGTAVITKELVAIGVAPSALSFCRQGSVIISKLYGHMA